MEIDFYRVLGVLDGAEEAVIKAAYKALIQIYHPDRYPNGSKAQSEANHKAIEINEAYRILSNPELRKKYDKERFEQRNQYEPETENATEEQKINDVLAEQWDVARQFVDGLDELNASLAQISPELSFTFRLALLDSKRFAEANKIGRELEKSFLEKFFGKNEDVHLFVKWLLLNRQRDIALEVNKAVNILGASFETSLIIRKLVTKHKLQYPTKNTAANDVKAGAKTAQNKTNPTLYDQIMYVAPGLLVLLFVTAALLIGIISQR